MSFGIRPSLLRATLFHLQKLSVSVLLVFALCSNAMGDSENSFRQQFEQWYRSNPPDTSEPATADRELLERYKPVYFLGAEARLPINFYTNYIANGELFDGAGQLISRNPSRELLNSHRVDPTSRFVFKGGKSIERNPAVYGRVDRDIAAFESGARPLVFLTYTLVFEVSGILKGLPGWKELLLQAIANLDDWHQLDHYINVTVVIDESESRPVPVAVVFQHHNYMRTWRLIGPEGPGRLQLADDARVRADIALRSNEVYPHREQPHRWRAVSFMQGAAASYVVNGTKPPFQSGEDLTDPARRLDDLPLIALPHSDAFYTFRGSLGKSRLLPGRSGPPGADFNTLAALKSPVTQLVVSYWYEGLANYPELLSNTLDAAWSGQPVDLTPFMKRFEVEAGW